MGLRAYKYYTSTPPFFINKKKKKRSKKHSEKIQYKIENISSEAKYVQKIKH